MRKALRFNISKSIIIWDECHNLGNIIYTILLLLVDSAKSIYTKWLLKKDVIKLWELFLKIKADNL